MTERPSEYIKLCWLAGVLPERALYELKRLYPDFLSHSADAQRIRETFVIDTYTRCWRNLAYTQTVNWRDYISAN